MQDLPWPTLLTAALGGTIGALLGKLLDIVYQEVRRRSDSVRTARRFLDEHLDPLLKAADELVGKLRALALEDFRSLDGVPDAAIERDNRDHVSIVFVLARFWARVEQMRSDGLSISLTEDPRGRLLQEFIECLESRHVRLVDRITQRAIAETMLVREDGGRTREAGLLPFIAQLEGDADIRRWYAPLLQILARSANTGERQSLIQYGIVVHAMIDVLDPKHHVTKDRPGFANKLTKRTWRDLRYRVFQQYLRSVKRVDKYIGPPRTRRP